MTRRCACIGRPKSSVSQYLVHQQDEGIWPAPGRYAAVRCAGACIEGHKSSGAARVLYIRFALAAMS